MPLLPPATAMPTGIDAHGSVAERAVVLSVAHAGRAYPATIDDLLTVPVERTVALEDRLADRLIDIAVARGRRTIVATLPRLLIDLNRAETDLDASGIVGARPAPMSLRARSGLGLLPQRLAGVGPLWRAPITPAELARRLQQSHRPFHAAIADALAAARARHGTAILIDVHSMPPLPGTGAADLVIGTRNGMTARAATVARILTWAKDLGLKVAIDTPYAGGHIIERHAAVERGVEAVQIEFDRRLYLDASLREPGPGLPIIANALADLADCLPVVGDAIAPMAAAAG